MSDYLPSTMACRLPGELMMDILSRLPVKTLLKFQLVSTSWRSLMKNLTFIQMPLNRDDDDERYIIVRRNTTTTITDMYTCSHDINTCKLTGVPHFGLMKAIGCCNGLLCSTLDEDYSPTWYGFRFIIINPAIRDYKHVYEAKSVHRAARDRKTVAVSLGFGFEASANDYKIVRIEQFEDNDDGTRVHTLCSVYSLNKNSWRSLEGVINGVLVEETSNAYVNGAVHWLAERENQRFIVSFDLRDEVLGEVMLPEGNNDNHDDDEEDDIGEVSDIEINVWEDCLAAIYYYEERDQKGFDITSMTEYGVHQSWVRVTDFGWDKDSISFLAGKWNGQLVYIDNDTQRLFSYDPYKEEGKEIVLPGFLTEDLEVFNYKESLIVVDGTTTFEFVTKFQLFMRSIRQELGLILLGLFVMLLAVLPPGLVFVVSDVRTYCVHGVFCALYGMACGGQPLHLICKGCLSGFWVSKVEGYAACAIHIWIGRFDSIFGEFIPRMRGRLFDEGLILVRECCINPDPSFVIFNVFGLRITFD